MKNFIKYTSGVLFFLIVGIFFSGHSSALSGSEFNAGRIIDDAVFFNSNSMSVGEIQNFLNGKVACDTNGTKMNGGVTRAQYAASRGVPTTFTCLPQYRENISNHQNNIGNPSYSPPGSMTAAEIIYKVSADHGVSSKALIVLLQKEQALVTDEWPFPRQYQIATGYGCPDTAPCDDQYYGFYNQVNKAAYQFKRYVNNSSAYRYKAGQVNSVLWSPTTSCGASNVFIENGATAALYNYTPYRPNTAALNNLYGSGDGCSAYDNRNFWRYFRDWFGSTTGVDYGTWGCYPASNELLGNRARVAMSNSLRNDGIRDWAKLTIASGTGTKCMEIHEWQDGMQNWRQNLGTPMAAFNPANGELIMADYDGDGKDDNIIVLYKGTGSGKIEIHVMSDNLMGWKAHIATNTPTVTAGYNTKVIFGDTNGDRKDEPFLVRYNNTGSGKIEIHGWTQNFQGWTSHVATNLNVQNASVQVIFRDVNGDRVDEPSIIIYTNTGSGKIEIHGWTQNFQGWTSHVATNFGVVAPDQAAEVIFGNTSGDYSDEGYLVLYNNTGSGKIEIHGWTQNFQGWTSHVATNVSL